MPKSNDDGIPGCCLGGAQDKVQAEFIDGRFVVQQGIGPLYIASRPALPIDPKKLAEFRNEPGPPSIVDTIIAQRQEAYEGAVDAWSADFPMHAEGNIKLLSELEDNAIRRRQQLFGRGLLLTAEQLCDRLGISNDTLSQVVRERRMFYIDGDDNAEWYPSFFADASIRRDIERVCVELGDLPGAVKWAFFTMPKYSLNSETPIAALSDGKLDRVLRTAAEFTERDR